MGGPQQADQEYAALREQPFDAGAYQAAMHQVSPMLMGWLVQHLVEAGFFPSRRLKLLAAAGELERLAARWLAPGERRTENVIVTRRGATVANERVVPTGPALPTLSLSAGEVDAE